MVIFSSSPWHAREGIFHYTTIFHYEICSALLESCLLRFFLMLIIVVVSLGDSLRRVLMPIVTVLQSTQSVYCEPFERQVQFGSWQRLLHWHDNNPNTAMGAGSPLMVGVSASSSGGFGAISQPGSWPSHSACAECRSMVVAGWSPGLLSWCRRDGTTGHLHHWFPDLGCT